jgi:hypothetical protein
MKFRVRGLIVCLTITFLACCFYFAALPKKSSSDSTGKPRSRNRAAHRGLPRQPTMDNQPPDETVGGPCRTLGVSCASQYFATWTWPADGSCNVSIRDGYPVPDSRCTPGGVVPGVSADVLQDPLWRTRCIRNCQSSESQKHVTYEWYSLVRPKQNNGANQVCELDHLVPLELGGADGLGNIWPQCGLNEHALQDRYFKRKDRVENYLAAKVRAGEMPLLEAQRGIAADWTQYLAAAEKLPRRARSHRGG